jgi:hypothetical protein
MTTGQPPKKQRQARSDSATAAIRAAKNAALPDLRPPAHVRISADAEPYFADIVRARARDEWNPHQLTIAAQMAHCMVEQEEVGALLLLEGRVLANERGTRVANPLVSIMEQLARRQMALGRSLQMIGRGVGDPRAKTKQRQLENNARGVAGEVEQEDDLLA